MREVNIQFYECEHDGDLQNYIEDIEQSGGEVLDSSLNYEAEVGSVKVKIDDTFLDKFKETDAYQFIN